MICHALRTVVSGMLVGLLACSAAAQTTWLVSNDPAESPDFSSLYAALESPLVVGGDTIEVSQGLGPYTTPMDTTHRFHGKAITVRAQVGERPVIRSSWSSAVVGLTFYFKAEDTGAVLDGLEIVAVGQQAIVVEGGSPTIRNCLFGNTGRDATVRVSGGHGRFESCTFDGIGTGGFNQYVLVFSTGSLTFTNCIVKNAVNPFGSIRSDGNLTLKGCEFNANASGFLGDINSTGTLWIESCRFIDTAKQPPGLFDPQSVIVSTGPTTIVNSLFKNSSVPQRSLIRFSAQGSPAFRTIANCTFFANPVQSIVLSSGTATAYVVNSIVWGNTLSAAVFQGGSLVAYSDIQGGWTGTGNINVNPSFRSTAQGDFRLNDGSPMIDRGDNSSVPAGISLDLAGKPRFFDDPATPNNFGNGVAPHVDLGAFEYQGPDICVPDLTTTANPFQPGFGQPNGILNNEDFFYYLSLFSAANPAADMTTTAIPGSPGFGMPNGVINNDDFFYYLALFAAGCD